MVHMLVDRPNQPPCVCLPDSISYADTCTGACRPNSILCRVRVNGWGSLLHTVAAQQPVAHSLVSIRSVTGPPTQRPMASSTILAAVWGGAS